MRQGPASSAKERLILGGIQRAQRRLNQAYAEQLRLVGELVRQNLATRTGYGSPARLLQDLLRINRAQADRLLTHAVALARRPAAGGPLPRLLSHTADALGAGELNADHVQAIHRAMSDLPDTAPAEDVQLAEKLLVQAAHTVSPSALAALGRTIVDRLHHNGRPPADPASRQPANRLSWSPRRGGQLQLKGQLSAEGAGLLTTVLGPLAAPRPATGGQRDARTTAERRGDALVDALRLAANSDDLPSHGGQRPTLVLTMTMADLRRREPVEACGQVPVGSQESAGGPATAGGRDMAGYGQGHLDGVGFIAPGLARRLACDCAVIPAVLGSRSEPLDIGRRSRVVPTAIRRALVLRDGGCAFPGCTVPASWCDAHHLRHWADGGGTAIDNLALMCGYHHDLLHQSGWRARMRDGRPEFVAPAYLDPSRTPRRNPLHSGFP
jgi:hypothetical protein